VGGCAVLRLGRDTEKRLRAARVRLERADENSAIMRGVTTNARFFNKPATNLLIKRARNSLPYLLCVDEDLHYLGQNPAVAQVFGNGTCLRGWRVLAACSDVGGERIDDLIASGLAVVGNDGREPALVWPLVSSTLAGPSSSLTRLGVELFASEEAPLVIGRDEEVDQVAAALVTDDPLMPVVLGESGVGKTTVARAALQRIADMLDGRAFSIDLGVLLAGALLDADRENRIATTLSECRQACVNLLIIENLQLGLVGATHVPYLLAESLADGVRVAATIGPSDRPLVDRPPLARRAVHVTLIEPRREETAEILRVRLGAVCERHNAWIPEPVIEMIVDATAPLAGAFPAKAIALAEVALARARLMGDTALSAEHIQIAAAGFAEPVRERTGQGR
jgi:hypothetical protein